MAGEPAFEGLVKLLKAASAEAIPAMEEAAAREYVAAIRQAAPRRTGALRASVGIFKGRNKKALTGPNVTRLLVGPGKTRGFYGFFLEHGWKAPTGPRVTYQTIRADRWNPKGTIYTTGRRRRTTGGAAHSQMGREGFTEIPARPWFDAAARAADPAAESAALEAFNRKLDEENSRV